MHSIRRARGLAAALLFSIAGTSCRESVAPSGPGRLAPTAAALAFSSVLPEDAGAPVIPLRSARVRLFRLPGEVPERAVLDTVVPFTESDPDRALTLGIAVTMVSERFGLELSLIDDQHQVAYRARDTVIAYTGGQAPPSKAVTLRYVGADTAVTRIALSTPEGVIAVGEATPLQASAFLRDGRSTSARFGFAVHGTAAITVDGEGVLRASAPVPKGSAWIVARLATGLADSIAAEAIVPAASLTLSAASARVDVGDRITLDAVARDAAGVVLPGTRTVWSTSDEGIATVMDGVVTGVARGNVVIAARTGRVSAQAAVSVGPPKVARVALNTSALSVVRGRTAGVSVRAFDAEGVELVGRPAAWSVGDVAIASVIPSGSSAIVRGLAVGETTLGVDVEGVQMTIAVVVADAPAARVVIAPHGITLIEGDQIALDATVLDAAGARLSGKIVGWRSADPSIASVDGNGVVRSLSGGRTSVVASVDAVADTITVVSRHPTTLTITRTGTTFDSRGEIGAFLVSSFDQTGAPIDNPVAQWSVTPGATLVGANGSTVQLIIGEKANVILSARARGLRADLSVVGAAVRPPASVPVPPVPPPVSPPKRG